MINNFCQQSNQYSDQYHESSSYFDKQHINKNINNNTSPAQISIAVIKKTILMTNIEKLQKSSFAVDTHAMR